MLSKRWMPTNIATIRGVSVTFFSPTYFWFACALKLTFFRLYSDSSIRTTGIICLRWHQLYTVDWATCKSWLLHEWASIIYCNHDEWQKCHSLNIHQSNMCKCIPLRGISRINWTWHSRTSIVCYFDFSFAINPTSPSSAATNNRWFCSFPP